MIQQNGSIFLILVLKACIVYISIYKIDPLSLYPVSRFQADHAPFYSLNHNHAPGERHKKLNDTYITEYKCTINSAPNPFFQMKLQFNVWDTCTQADPLHLIFKYGEAQYPTLFCSVLLKLIIHGPTPFFQSTQGAIWFCTLSNLEALVYHKRKSRSYWTR